MNREKAKKLLAALIFDDLDESSKSELLTYLQTDDELRERLADMRMAAKVSCDSLQHGPDPVLGKRRLKSLARLAGRRSPRPTIFTARNLAAVAAVLAAVLLPVLFILPGSNRVRLYSRKMDSASKVKAEYMIEDTGESQVASSQPMQSPGGGIGSKNIFAFDAVDETRQHSMQREIRDSSPSVRPMGQTEKYSLLPPVTNRPLVGESHYYMKSNADEIAGTEISLSGNDNLYTMNEADRIVGGRSSVPGGDQSANPSWLISAGYDDYLEEAPGSEPSSGMGISGGGGMYGGGGYGGGVEMGGHGGYGGMYGGGGYGGGVAMGGHGGYGGMRDGSGVSVDNIYAFYGPEAGGMGEDGGIKEGVTSLSPYTGTVPVTGLDVSTDSGDTISNVTVASPIVTDGQNVTFIDGHFTGNEGAVDSAATMLDAFTVVTGPGSVPPAFPGGGTSGPSNRPDSTLQPQGGVERVVAMGTDGEALFDGFGSRVTLGKDYIDAMKVNAGQGAEARKRDHEKTKSPSARSGIIQHGLRGEVSKEEVASSLDKATRKHDTTSTRYAERPVLMVDEPGLSHGEGRGRDGGDYSLIATDLAKLEINGGEPMLGDVPVFGEIFRDREGGKSALPEEQAQRTARGLEDMKSALEDKAERTESELYIPAIPSLGVMKQKGKRDADLKKAEELAAEAKKLLPHKPVMTVGAITTAPTAASVPSTGEIQKVIDAAEDGDMVVVKSGSYNGNINLVGKEIELFSSAPDDSSILAKTMTDGKSARRTLLPESDSEIPASQPEGEPVEMEYEIIQLKHAEPGEVKASVVDCLMDLPGMQSSLGVSVEALTQRGQIVVSGSKDMREKVKNMVQQIDKRRPQVLLDANSIIVEEDGTDLPEASRFKLVPVNPWVMAGRDSLSTFALDVDTASYTLCRRYIRGGFLPPPGAVRMEEFINYFNYQYPQRANPTFKVHAEAARSPFAGKGKDLTLLKIGVKARTIGRDQRKAAHLVFVVDASASMDQPDRLPLVQKALGLLVDKLSAADRVSLITCADEARLHMEATSAGDREKIRGAIDAIQPSGSTNLLAGLKLGYAAARRAFAPKLINHVILCSDGVANVGQTEAEAVLKAVAAERKQGITITCVGVGYGSYNDAFLETLANRGDGSYVFLDSAGHAQRVFVEQLAATLQTVAKDARIQVDFNPDRVRRYRLIGYENRDIEDKRFRDDTIDAGEVGSGQCSTALYELELIGGQSSGREEDLGTVFVRYRHAETGQIEEISSRLRSSVVRRRTVESAPRFYLAACAARFAEILRQSEHAQDGNLTDILGVAEQVCQALPLDRDVRELAELIRKAEHLPASP